MILQSNLTTPFIRSSACYEYLWDSNDLIHNLYGSFVGEIEDQMLPVNDLVHEDVEVYTEKTELTAYNFGVYSKVVRKAIEQHNKYSQQDAAKNAAPLL